MRGHAGAFAGGLAPPAGCIAGGLAPPAGGIAGLFAPPAGGIAGGLAPELPIGQTEAGARPVPLRRHLKAKRQLS